MGHPDRHAVGIAEAHRVQIQVRNSRALRRLENHRPGPRLEMDLVSWARLSPTPRATARPVRIARRPPGLAHHEMIVIRATTSRGRDRPHAMKAQHRQPKSVEGHRTGEIAHLDCGAGRTNAAALRLGVPRRAARRAETSVRRQKELVELRRLDVGAAQHGEPGRDDGSDAGRDAPGSRRRCWAAASDWAAGPSPRPSWPSGVRRGRSAGGR